MLRIAVRRLIHQTNAGSEKVRPELSAIDLLDYQHLVSTCVSVWALPAALYIKALRTCVTFLSILLHFYIYVSLLFPFLFFFLLFTGNIRYRSMGKRQKGLSHDSPFKVLMAAVVNWLADGLKFKVFSPNYMLANRDEVSARSGPTFVCDCPPDAKRRQLTKEGKESLFSFQKFLKFSAVNRNYSYLTKIWSIVKGLI